MPWPRSNAARLPSLYPLCLSSLTPTTLLLSCSLNATHPLAKPTKSAANPLVCTAPHRTAPTPVQPGWYMAEIGENCDDGCGAAGLVCTEASQQAHNSEVDTPAEMQQVVTETGGSTSSCTGGYGSNQDVPAWSPDGTGWCAHSAPSRTLDTFNCAATTEVAKRRLCYCEAGMSNTVHLTKATPRHVAPRHVAAHH